MTLKDMVRRTVRRYPQKTAFILGDTRYTFEELDRRARRLAGALADMGLGKGDRVAVLAGGCPQYAETYLACAKSGVIVVPLNNRLGSGELSYIINDSEASVLILEKGYLELVDSMRQDLKGLGNS
jgi:acyl-CoA synthetase (AMP-forming)/AMP-acid ligase II